MCEGELGYGSLLASSRMFEKISPYLNVLTKEFPKICLHNNLNYSKVSK